MCKWTEEFGCSLWLCSLWHWSSLVPPTHPFGWGPLWSRVWLWGGWNHKVASRLLWAKNSDPSSWSSEPLCGSSPPTHTHISSVSAGTSFSLPPTPVWCQPYPCSKVSGEFSFGPCYKLNIKALCREAAWSYQTRWTWQVLASPALYQPVNQQAWFFGSGTRGCKRW